MRSPHCTLIQVASSAAVETTVAGTGKAESKGASHKGRRPRSASAIASAQSGAVADDEGGDDQDTAGADAADDDDDDDEGTAAAGMMRNIWVMVVACVFEV